MKVCQHDSYAIYRQLIDPLRERARELGYALAVHGSLKRDIDLIAVPWTREAVDQVQLAEQLRLTAEKINNFAFLIPPEADDPHHQHGCPGMKPHGRRVWSYHLGGGPYIDLSVMPPAHLLRIAPFEEMSSFADDFSI